MTSNAPAAALPSFASRVMPVIVITDVAQAVPLAHALLEGGVDVMEITLRHAAGLPAIEAVARAVPDMRVGAGTVTQAAEFARVQQAGGQFALSPGCTPSLVQAAQASGLPWLPGAFTPSEVMQAREAGYRLVKLFPAQQAGGLAMLKALAGPLPDMRFCPTGGVSLDNLPDYLQLSPVALVGGSWLTPLNLVEGARWNDITRLTRQARDVQDRVLGSAAASL